MKRDNFLSNIMNFNCGVLDFKIDDDFRDLNKFGFVYSKTKVSTDYSVLAQKNNFYLADVTVKLSRRLSEKYEFFCEKEKIIIANEKLRKPVVKLAEENFVFDRFHSDPNISDEVASKIKRLWVENYFNGIRGDKCFVSLDKTEVKGFLLTVIRKNEVVIDLIAVDKKFRNHGVATDLINGMVSYYRKEFSIFSVGTQVSNMASIRLYQKCDFNISEYGLVWHYFNKQ